MLCSPPAEHAGQILASVAAGKRAVLCEKPLATTVADAEAVIDACRAAGTALLVGTNHLYDPAWGRAKHHLLAGGHTVRAISVTLALPPNGRYHDVVTELAAPAAAPGARRPRPVGDPRSRHPSSVSCITGLAVHDLPMLRDLAPVLERGRVRARGRADRLRGRLPRVGHSRCGSRPSCFPDGADALWRLDITTDTDLVEVSFPPAFVHVGQRRGAGAHPPTGKRHDLSARCRRTATSPSGVRSPTC